MRILRLPAVKSEMGYRTDAIIYNAIRAGTFTAGVHIGQRSKGWPDYEARAINAARIAGKSDVDLCELIKVLHGNRTGLIAEVLAVSR